jgi:hypothetical protein
MDQNTTKAMSPKPLEFRWFEKINPKLQELPFSPNHFLLLHTQNLPEYLHPRTTRDH